MVAPLYTHLQAPTDAPSCATCKHRRFRRGTFLLRPDMTLCAHPMLIGKVTGEMANAYWARYAVHQNQVCGVTGSLHEALTTDTEEDTHA